MSPDLTGKKVAFVVANEGVEEVELTRPWEAVRDAGGTPVLVAPKEGDVQAFNHLDKAGTFAVDQSTADARIDDFAAVVLPGGVANPDQLRMDGPATELIKEAFAAGIPVAAICHGPWTLIDADCVSGRTLTSWPSLQTDLRNAGATWVDEELHVDGNLITSRKPDDLDAFCQELVSATAGSSRAR